MNRNKAERLPIRKKQDFLWRLLRKHKLFKYFFQSKSIYMDLQTTICIGFVPSTHTNTIQLSWNRTSLFVLTSWCFDNIMAC